VLDSRVSGGAWFVFLLVCLISIFGSAAPPQEKKSSASYKKTECGQKSDRRYAVCRGAWSGKTISLFNTWSAPDTNPERRLRFPSPEGTRIITVNGFQVRLHVNGKQYWAPFGNMHDSEVGWAPDSTRLFVTWSESGELGTWHVQVYDVTERGLKEIKGVTNRARADMLRRERKAPIPRWVTRVYRPMWDSLDYCEPDMIGSQWLNGTKEILVAAGAGPDSGCKYMGEWVMYRLDVTTGQILEAYTSREAHRIFGDDDLPKLYDDNEDLLGAPSTN